MRFRVLPALVLLPVLLATGCGSGGTTVGGGNQAPAVDATPAGAKPAAFDPRDAPIGCLASKGIQAQKDVRETNRLDILPTASGAYIQFAATPADADAIQLHNQAPGAEIIGPRLLTVGRLGDDELGAIETCLQGLGARY